MGFWAVLTLVFVVAKLAGYVSWSWWLVFLPMAFGMAIGVVVLFSLFLLTLIAEK